MLEVTQAHVLLQVIHKFEKELALMKSEIYATIPTKRKPPKMVFIDPETGKPFELKRKKASSKNSQKKVT